MNKQEMIKELETNRMIELTSGKMVRATGFDWKAWSTNDVEELLNSSRPIKEESSELQCLEGLNRLGVLSEEGKELLENLAGEEGDRQADEAISNSEKDIDAETDEILAIEKELGRD